jgi:hypothetical protein
VLEVRPQRGRRRRSRRHGTTRKWLRYALLVFAAGLLVAGGLAVFRAKPLTHGGDSRRRGTSWRAAHAGKRFRRRAGADPRRGFGCQGAVAGEPCPGVLRSRRDGAALRPAVPRGAGQRTPVSGGCGARSRGRRAGGGSVAAPRAGARVRRRAFLRRKANRHGRRRASGLGRRLAVARLSSASRTSRAPGFSRNGALPRCSSTARATPSARWRSCVRRWSVFLRG